MHKIHIGVAPGFCGGKDLPEVLALPVIDHIEHAVGLPVGHPPADRGQVGGGIEEGAVGLADQQRRLVWAVGEDADGGTALAGEAPGEQLIDHLAKHRLVEALAKRVVEGDMQAGVDAVDLGLTDRHERLPEASVFRIPLVELGRFQQHLAAELWVLGGQASGLGIGSKFVFFRIGGLPHEPVQAAELGGGIDRIGRLVAAVLPAPEDHAKLRAPVTEMVVGDHSVAAEAENPGQGVADYRGADVAHMHRLGDVGRRVVDDNGLGLLNRGHAQPRIGHGLSHKPPQGRIPHGEVDEAGANRIARGIEKLAGIEPGDDRFGDLPGRLARLLGQRHRDGRGIVAKLRIGGGPHHVADRQVDGSWHFSGSGGIGDGSGNTTTKFLAEIHSRKMPEGSGWPASVVSRRCSGRRRADAHSGEAGSCSPASPAVI